MRVIAVSVAIVICAGVLLDAQRRHPVSGRVFAPVMGVGGAGWLERPEREDEEAPSRALDALALKPGMVVADIGAGSGYYSSRIAKRVGPTGRVYATDIQPGMIELLKRRIASEGLTNVTTVLGGLDDPRLPPNAIRMKVPKNSAAASRAVPLSMRGILRYLTFKTMMCCHGSTSIT